MKCNTGRGVTEEQRAKLVAALENPEHDRFPARTARDAAKEIERLAKENKRLKRSKTDPRDVGVAE